MVLSDVLLLNWNQKNGNLANVTLGGAFCSATFRRRSGGLIDVDLGGNKTTNHTKHADT